MILAGVSSVELCRLGVHGCRFCASLGNDPGCFSPELQRFAIGNTPNRFDFFSSRGRIFNPQQDL
jgi:hypothetical protein